MCPFIPAETDWAEGWMGAEATSSDKTTLTAPWSTVWCESYLNMEFLVHTEHFFLYCRGQLVNTLLRINCWLLWESQTNTQVKPVIVTERLINAALRAKYSYYFALRHDPQNGNRTIIFNDKYDDKLLVAFK
jgi:hypothetical protein